MEGTCYAQLQPVPFNIGSLITTSICLPEDSYPGYTASDVHYSHAYGYSSEDSGSPDSPEKDLSDIQEVLQQRMTGCSRDYDSDNASVSFDFQDLGFLDQDSRDEAAESSLDCSRHHLSVIVEPGYHLHHRSTFSRSHSSTHTHSAHPQATPPPPTPPALFSPSPLSSPSSLPSASSSLNLLRVKGSPTWHNVYYLDTSANVLSHSGHYHSPAVTPPAPHHFPPTPSPSPSPRLLEGAGVMQYHQTPMEEQELDDDEDAEYKPYCDSRRGAKKNLLWKFLLWVLDNQTDLAQWTDVRKGIFKFVDTARISTMWGQRKHKRDMTFEKLSRGIRHYYKRGLMERMPHTRLVYKFNWEKVPRRFRKF